MNILGIETSCDETSAAVVRSDLRVLSNVIQSQIDLHERYGGVVPELASRRHIVAIVPTIDLALEQAGVTLEEIDAIAVTEGPGLAGSLLVGINVAKALALSRGLPLIPVNHLEGHIYANWLTMGDAEPQPAPTFPLVCLIVSGGHTELLLMRDHGNYELLGRTIDDAAGEAFDKGARILGLGFPGGPAIQKASANARVGQHPLPRAWLGESFDFSFSGLKTALLREAEQYRRPRVPAKRGAKDEPFATYEPIHYGPNVPVNDIAADYQDAIVDVLVEKTARAARDTRASTVLLAGGVAANELLRRRLQNALTVPLRYPPVILCTDNAAMIAGAAHFSYRRGERGTLELDIHPQLAVDDRDVAIVVTNRTGTRSMEETSLTPSIRSVAIEAARDAGRILRENYGKVQQVKYKGEVDIVTEVDEASERLITERIQQYFPGHHILGEEGGTSRSPESESRYRWIIDPVDGTTNYAHGYPFFCVSIGVEVDGVVQFGAVYAPALDELFVAELGAGAFLNGERLVVSSTDHLIRSLLASGFNTDRDLARSNLPNWERLVFKTQALRRDGAAALNLCYVAAGRFDGYWEIGLKPWDAAAGVLIVREAGGTVTDFSGTAHVLTSSTLVATNGILHNALRDELTD